MHKHILELTNESDKKLKIVVKTKCYNLVEMQNTKGKNDQWSDIKTFVGLVVDMRWYYDLKY